MYHRQQQEWFISLHLICLLFYIWIFIYRREKYEVRAKTNDTEVEILAEMQKKFEERRKNCQSSLEDRITRRMRYLDLTFPSKVEEIPPEEEEEAEEEFVQLTSDIEVNFKRTDWFPTVSRLGKCSKIIQKSHFSRVFKMTHAELWETLLVLHMLINF